jgi:hypothetical protein
MAKEPEFPTPEMLQCRNAAPELLLGLYEVVTNPLTLQALYDAAVKHGGVEAVSTQLRDWVVTYRTELDKVKAHTRRQALAKLTPAERAALGFP